MNQFERPTRINRPEPSRIVGRRAIRPGNPLDRDFDNLFAEAGQMQKQMIKSLPWYMKVWAALSVLFSVAVAVGVIILLVVLIRHFA